MHSGISVALELVAVLAVRGGAVTLLRRRARY